VDTQTSKQSRVEPREREERIPSIVGPIPEPEAEPGAESDRKPGARASAPRWERIPVDDYDNLVDGSAIEGKSGNYLFTVGNVGSGKSTIQSSLIHRLWSDSRILFEYATTDGNPAHDAYLNGWVQNIGNGYFPARTKAGRVREFTVRTSSSDRRACPARRPAISTCTRPPAATGPAASSVSSSTAARTSAIRAISESTRTTRRRTAARISRPASLQGAF
jgi:ABC-type dipeptide/oligopeptide/nickel transport system ATPase component